MTKFIPLPPPIEAAYIALMDEMKNARAAGDQNAFGALLLKAWNLIPEPKLQHDRAQSTVRALIEHYRDSGRAAEAVKWLPTLRTAYGGGPNPSVDFLAATALMADGQLEKAFELFENLYAEYGRRPFQGKDPKYLRFYEQRKKTR